MRPTPCRGQYARALALCWATLVLSSLVACGDSDTGPVADHGDVVASPERPDPVAEPAGDPDAPDGRERDGPWIDVRGTSSLGFGILRVVPPAGGPGRFRIDYRDTPDGYVMSDNAQLFVLPGDAFADDGRAYADDFLAFSRTEEEGGGASSTQYLPASASYASEGDALHVSAEFTVDREQTVLVGYGPWTGPDVGRPSGDEHTFHLTVVAESGAWEWIESEAGELVTTNWTGRPEVERGGPVVDPVSGRRTWIEVQPLILYDARFARAADEPPEQAAYDGPSPDELDKTAAALRAAGRKHAALDAEERAADLRTELRRRDGRIVLTPRLARLFRRVPIRWR